MVIQIVSGFLVCLGGGTLLGGQEGSAQDQTEQLRSEETEDYYLNWLKQDVAYIITPEEKDVFQNLRNDAEKDSFIEQFWRRRDSDPQTSINEFKEEHYRRLAFVNERFGSGLPGWRTDRGKTYIIHGPPDQIDPHPSGGTYDRPTWEGGGQTATFPFEIWRYRHIEGLGSDIELEFVDRSYSGEYKLALDPEEKDTLLYIPGAGLMEAERMGLATRAMRPYFDPSADYPAYGRQKDGPFDRFLLWNRIHHPPALKYPELREVVKVDLSYGRLPFSVRVDYFRLNETEVLAAISMEVKNKDLNWADEMGAKVARVAVYGIVTGMTQEIVSEFDDALVNRFTPSDYQAALASTSLYQKILPLDAKKRYKLSLVVKDISVNNIDVVRQALLPPSFEEPTLAASTLIMSDSYELNSAEAMADRMFVIGNVWIHPSLDKTFAASKPIGAFFHVYNMALDQTTYEPSLQAKYEVLKEGKTVLRLVEHNNESLQYFSEKALVFVKQLPAQRLGPGSYQLQIEVRDQIKNEAVTLQERFEIRNPDHATAQTVSR